MARHFPHHTHVHQEKGRPDNSQAEVRLREVEAKLDLIIRNQETNMVDTTTVKAALARLKADDELMIAMLHSQRDTNDANAVRIAALVQQIADLIAAGSDATALRAELEAVKADLTAMQTDLSAQADVIEGELAANPATPDLPPAPVEVPAPAPVDPTSTANQ